MTNSDGLVGAAEAHFQRANPLVRGNGYSPLVTTGYKIVTSIAWVAFVATALEYSFKRPSSGRHRHTIWEENRLHLTPFSLEPIIVSIYWSLIFIVQIPYLLSFYSSNDETSTVAFDLAPHFTATTLLSLGFIHLWTRDLLWWALLVAVINFLNLIVAYLSLPVHKARRAQHATHAPVAEEGAESVTDHVRNSFRSWTSGSESPEFNFRLVQHYAVLAGPLAFSFISLYWVGAAALNIHTLFGRILANVAVWGILGFGGFCLVVFGDWLLALNLSALASSIGISQLFVHTVALQWIFAFVISGILCVTGLLVAIPSMLPRGRVEIDGERRPLLAD